MAVIDGYIKKLKQEDIDRLNDWVDLAWKSHWKELGSKSSSKAKFREYVFRDNKPADELLRILHAIRQQTAMWRKQSKIEKVMGIPHLSSWYNGGRWDDDITHDNTGTRERVEVKTCTTEGCNEDVHGPAFDKCAFHLPDSNRERLKDSYIRTGLDKSSPTFIEDCRKYCRERFNILLERGMK